MSVGMSVLAILDEGRSYGLRVRNEFEARTGGVWPLNVGQVYATLARLERDGLVRVVGGDGPETQKVYEITGAGREALERWFTAPVVSGPPARDELVLKLVMATAHPSVRPADVIQAERRHGVELLQQYTRLKRDAPSDADIGWLFLLDSLIFQAEARVRWLDACEARLARSAAPPRRPSPADAAPVHEETEVRR